MPLPPAKRNRQEDADASPNDEASAAKKAAKSDVENTTPSHDVDDLETAGTNPTPIFLKKTYKMIDSCDPDIAGWSPDGLSFIVKDTEIFASDIIPQYFDHNKFSSFARQLNCKYMSYYYYRPRFAYTPCSYEFTCFSIT